MLTLVLTMATHIATSASAWHDEPGGVQERDILFLSIGSEHYVDHQWAQSNGLKTFSRIRGINRSAEMVSEALLLGQARFGVTLTSQPGRHVTKQDIATGVERILNEAANWQQPFIFVYIAGHGLQNSFAETQMFIPGDLVVDPESLSEVDPVADLYWHALPIGELAYELLGEQYPYIMIVDTCREGGPLKDAEFSLIAGAEQSENMREISEMVKGINQSLGAPNIIIYSTEPGNVVSTVPDPFSDNDLDSLAPLARRIGLSVAGALDRQEPIPLVQLLDDLVVNDGLDSATQTGWANAAFGPEEEDLYMFYAMTQLLGGHSFGGEMVFEGFHEEMTGTGETPRVCCERQDDEIREVWIGPYMSVVFDEATR